MRKIVQYKEILLAEECIMRHVQRESFARIQDERIACMDPFLEEEGIIHLRTRIVERADMGDFAIPVMLPSRHPIVERLMLSAHVKSYHVGVQGLLSLLREKFWILKGRKSIRAILLKCVRCRRHEARRITTSQPVLPEPQVRDAVVFETTDVDVAGPLFLRYGRKVWVCFYTCAVYRAIYLELALLLSTDSFIQTFRRFVARCGRPAIVYSDNGTNFVGLGNAFAHLEWEQIFKHCAIERIKWRFNPLAAAWWGGWWERLIRLLIQLLYKTLRKASLTYEELETVLCDCESIINSRPLTYVSEDVTYLVPVTTNMFLLDLKGVGLADCDAVDSGRLNRRARYQQKVKESLQQRFKKECLGQLVLTAKKKGRKLQPREVVLLRVENSKRVDWPLAVIEELIPGRDGEVRLVRLRTASGVLRPVQRAYPLETHKGEPRIPDQMSAETAQETQETVAPPEKDDGSEGVRVQTRSGREIKLPSRFLMQLWVSAGMLSHFYC
jgi:hypothetical protein